MASCVSSLCRECHNPTPTRFSSQIPECLGVRKPTPHYKIIRQLQLGMCTAVITVYSEFRLSTSSASVQSIPARVQLITARVQLVYS